MNGTPEKPTKTAQTAAETRLATALRDNLSKRKQQQRARATESPDTTTYTDPQ